MKLLSGTPRLHSSWLLPHLLILIWSLISSLNAYLRMPVNLLSIALGAR